MVLTVCLRPVSKVIMACCHQVIDSTGRWSCEPFPCLKDQCLSDPGAPRQTDLKPAVSVDSGVLCVSVKLIWVSVSVLQVCDTSDEEDPERSRQRNLHQTAGGGEREERQLRPRGQWTQHRTLCDSCAASVQTSVFKTSVCFRDVND